MMMMITVKRHSYLWYNVFRCANKLKVVSCLTSMIASASDFIVRRQSTLEFSNNFVLNIEYYSVNTVLILRVSLRLSLTYPHADKTEISYLLVVNSTYIPIGWYLFLSARVCLCICVVVCVYSCLFICVYTCLCPFLCACICRQIVKKFT